MPNGVTNRTAELQATARRYYRDGLRRAISNASSRDKMLGHVNELSTGVSVSKNEAYCSECSMTIDDEHKLIAGADLPVRSPQQPTLPT
jgi:hypothetical protein